MKECKLGRPELEGEGWPGRAEPSEEGKTVNGRARRSGREELSQSMRAGHVCKGGKPSWEGRECQAQAKRGGPN